MRMLAAKRIETPVIIPMMARTHKATSSLMSGNRASGTFIITPTPIVIAMKYKTVQRTLSHFGMMRNSSEKRSASFLRRKRIMRMRSLHESPMLCPMLGPGVLISSSSFPCECARSLGTFCACPFLQQDRSCRDDSWNKPPQRNTYLPNNSGQPQFAAEPFECAPNQRRAGQTEQPGNSCDGPEQKAARIVRGQFFCTHSHAKLCARSEIFRQFDIHAAEGGDCLCRLRLQRGTRFTLREMCGEPRFVS